MIAFAKLKRLRCLIFKCILTVFALFSSLPNSRATELLLNRSFENPVAPLNGNNFYETLPDWLTVPLPVVPRPVNLVRPFPEYAPGPKLSPPTGGDQYFDFRGTSGKLLQNVTIPSSGIVTIAAWFSVRDIPQNLNGLAIRFKNQSGVVVANGSTSFLAAEPLGVWREIRIENIPIPAGIYTFEADLPNPANIDLASVDFTPTGIAVVKTEVGLNDVDGNGPDQGDELNYSISVKNTGSAELTNITLADANAFITGGPIPTLAPGEVDTSTFNVKKILDQSEFDTSIASNQAVVTAVQPGGSSISDISDPLSFYENNPTTTILAPVNNVTIEKTADTIGPVNAGSTINYTYKVTNMGNITARNVSVSDNHNGTGTLPMPGSETLVADKPPFLDSTDLNPTDNAWSNLAPGDSVKFSAAYVVLQSDIDTLQ